MRKPTGSGVEWTECLLIIGTCCRVQVFSLILDSSVSLSADIQSARDLVSETMGSNPALSRGRQLVSLYRQRHVRKPTGSTEWCVVGYMSNALWDFVEWVYSYWFPKAILTLTHWDLPRQSGRHFADDIFRCIFTKEKISTLTRNSLIFVPKGPIDNWSVFFHVMALHQTYHKPILEPVMAHFSGAYMRHLASINPHAQL